ncbi:MAG: sigma-54 interaction domain-containing protein [Polyangiales bacterium]
MRSPSDVPPPIMLALEELAGGAIVLDSELRVVAATSAAVALVGDVPHGVAAPKFLCGHAVERPIAEALAAGRACTGLVTRPTRHGERTVRVAAVPLGPKHGSTRDGWILLLDEEHAEAATGAELFHGMWSADAGMKRVFRIVEKVARADANVLVRGDTGAGKELVAHAIHELSPRAKGPFRAINCAAMPASLLESELFGHVRGAFTGAVRDNPGHFRAAHGGTLFLDEVAELPLELQAKLLRVLESHEVMPIGGREAVKVDVRVVAATHRGLRAQVEAGQFRADLMYRLRVIPIFLPPLRARGEDVILLADRFVEQLNARASRKIARISPGAKRILSRYDWPGNVRELRNVLEYAFAIGEGPVLVESDLPPEIATPGIEAAAPAVNAPLPQAGSPEAARILRALERAAGNRARAAKSLGISRITLWRRMKELGLEHP